MNKAPKASSILKFAREQRGFTQAESAANFGVEERTLRRWENEEFMSKWVDVISLVEDVYSLNFFELIATWNQTHELV